MADQNRYPAGFAEALGHTIKVMRTDMRMSRRDLAEAAKVSYSGLTAIENGNNPPSSSLLVPIAAALGVRPSRLLELAEERMADEGDDLSTVVMYSEAPPRAFSPSPEQDWAERFASRGVSREAPGDGRDHAPQQRDAFAPGIHREIPGRQSVQARLARGESEHAASLKSVAMRELGHLLPDMDDEDIERLLDYARRLSR